MQSLAPLLHYLVLFGYLILEGGMRVGEGLAELVHESLAHRLFLPYYQVRCQIKSS